MLDPSSNDEVRGCDNGLLAEPRPGSFLFKKICLRDPYGLSPVEMLNIHSFLETESLYSVWVTDIDSLRRQLAVHLRLSASIKIFQHPAVFTPKY
jgi:hypothetical protein